MKSSEEREDAYKSASSSQNMKGLKSRQEGFMVVQTKGHLRGTSMVKYCPKTENIQIQANSACVFRGPSCLADQMLFRD